MYAQQQQQPMQDGQGYDQSYQMGATGNMQ